MSTGSIILLVDSAGIKFVHGDVMISLVNFIACNESENKENQDAL